MESLLFGILGLFGLNEPLVTVDVYVDIQVNIPGVERVMEDETSIDDLFIKVSGKTTGF